MHLDRPSPITTLSAPGLNPLSETFSSALILHSYRKGAPTPPREYTNGRGLVVTVRGQTQSRQERKMGGVEVRYSWEARGK